MQIESVTTRRGEPVLVLRTEDGKWVPGYIEFGDESVGVSIATEPAGARYVVPASDVRRRVQTAPEGKRPLRDERGISWDGWIKIGATCSVGRRSLWLREGDGFFELRAGREGGDAYVKVTVDNPQYRELLDVVTTAEFAAKT